VYCDRVEVGTGLGSVVGGADVGIPMVAVCVGVGMSVFVTVGLGEGVGLGNRVYVGKGVKVSATGWKGVAVALAFGSTVTRLMCGEEAGGFPEGREQAAKSTRQQSTLNARRVRGVMLVGLPLLAAA